MIVKPGAYAELEAQADSLIKASITSACHSEKADILTEWKWRDRQSHEILTPSPDPASHQGTFGRAKGADHMNSREGASGLRARRPRPQLAWLEYQGSNPQAPGIGPTCSGHHGPRPQNCTRNCQSSRS